MYSDNRDAYRQAFFEAWNKYKKKLPLLAVEAELIEVILLHPEYHSMLDKPQTYRTQEFSLEENPFFHMSLHLSIREQLRTNRPAGITGIQTALIKKYVDSLTVEHLMMDCLAKILWQAQQNGVMPDEGEYLKCLKSL